MKTRLDLALVEKGLLQSRERAKSLIMAGQVYVNHQKADKAGFLVRPEDAIEVRTDGIGYVSRGGLKLEKAAESFGLSLQNAICCDFGASTGGFTDCMLQNGASKVYAVDVGYGQLAWSLRNDPRVVNLERQNIRYLGREQIPDSIDFISVDVSFISLTLILPVVHQFLREDGQAVCLVKPQFEAGKGRVGKKGVVREPEIHREVVEKIVSFSLQQGFSVLGLDHSPIKGPEGNIEYLLYLKKGGAQMLLAPDAVAGVVEKSHQALQEKGNGGKEK